MSENIIIGRNVGLEIVFIEDIANLHLPTIRKPSFKTTPVLKDIITSRVLKS